MSRGRVLALMLVGAFLVSAPRTLPSTPPVGAAPPEPSTASAEPPLAEAIAHRIAQLNHHLSPAEVARIRDAVLRSSARYGIDPRLVTAVIEVESHARPWARSPKGALGLMQVMPYMMRPIGLAGNPSTIESNIEAGCMILAGNIRRLGEADGISAYFWGSQIRGVSYLDRVRAARDRLRSEIQS